MPAPLDGITVLDLTIYANGPWATVMLSDMGAEVIKIERPIHGDPGRHMWMLGSPRRPVNAFFETNNRNKKSVTLDLKSPEGLEIFHALAKNADVVTHSFRTGVVERLGVDYETVRRYNPRIVYAAASGWGSKGPDARDGVYDLVGQARSGLIAMLSAGEPQVAYRGAGTIVDQIGGVLLAQGILLGIIARDRYGVGQHIEVPQLGAAMLLQAQALNAYLFNGDPPRGGPEKRSGSPLFNVYRCGDGRWLAVGFIQSLEHRWSDVCHALGLEHLIDDPRYTEIENDTQDARELTALFDRTFATKPRDEWLAILKAHRAVCSPVQDYEELTTDPQVIANEYLAELPYAGGGTIREVGVPIKMSETPGAARASAPELGQHTQEVLAELSYTVAKIAALRDKGVI